MVGKKTDLPVRLGAIKYPIGVSGVHIPRPSSALGAFIDVQQSTAMAVWRLSRKTGLPLVGLVALLI
jgi:hypothetical protein